MHVYPSRWGETKFKDRAISLWCSKIREQTERDWDYLRVYQTVFQTAKWGTLGELAGKILK